ncbi:hypothetical protein C8F01DRAFT_1182022 [Mycena amicta]|nr:hypothetical protein C8F01DRAFT_1182022 [Mycena amicta]
MFYLGVAWEGQHGRGAAAAHHPFIGGLHPDRWDDQAMMNISGLDGKLDSGGQDSKGNPMGGLVYTNVFPSAGGNNAAFIQAQHWSLL